MDTITVKDFIEKYKVPFHATTVKRWIVDNEDKLDGVVMFKKNAQRTSIRILDAEKLFNVWMNKEK